MRADIRDCRFTCYPHEQLWLFTVEWSYCYRYFDSNGPKHGYTFTLDYFALSCFLFYLISVYFYLVLIRLSSIYVCLYIDLSFPSYLKSFMSSVNCLRWKVRGWNCWKVPKWSRSSNIPVSLTVLWKPPVWTVWCIQLKQDPLASSLCRLLLTLWYLSTSSR